MQSRKLPAHRSPRFAVKMSSLGKATKKVLAAASTALLVASALVLGVAAPASATEDCVPVTAWTETIIDQVYVPAVTYTAYQLYSWTKPQNQEADNPKTTPPGDDWQANNKKKPGDDFIGVAFASSENGNGNWFFWTATEVDTPAIEEVSHTVDHPAVTCEEPPAEYQACEGSTTLPTSTNLDQRDWVLKPGTAEYVDGGVKLTSTNWDGGKVTLATNFLLSEAGDVEIDYTQGTGSGSVALLFNTSDGNQIHYEPFVGYTQPWFADQTGVFNARTGSSGSEWADVDLSNLVSNPMVTSVVVGVWGGDSDVVTVHSATFNCKTHPFDYVAPAPVACTATGPWYTESDDAAPVLAEDGLVFTGGSGKAVGYRVPVTGNLQGIGTTSYVADGDQSKFYYRFVIDASADGGASYQSLTVTSGSPVTSASTVYVNHVGSMTIAEAAELYPNNQITSQGFHMDSAASSEDVVTLKSMNSPCGVLSFVPEKPQTPQPMVAVTFGSFSGAAPSCESPSVVWSRTKTTTTTPYKVVWQDGKWEVVLDTENATALTVRDEQTKTVTYEGDCPTIKPSAPKAFDPKCASDEGQNGSSSMGYIQLDLKDHLQYTIDGRPTSSARNFLGQGTHEVAVTADAGYKVDGAVSWTRTINPSFCPRTLALVKTKASMSNNTCSAQGSYTLANTAGVQWFVNGSATPTAAGTHKVSGKSTVNVEAKLIDPVIDGWEDGAQTQWTFKFADPTDCLPTLAFTGSNGNALGLLLASGLLLTGGVVLSLDQRRRRMAKGL